MKLQLLLISVLIFLSSCQTTVPVVEEQNTNNQASQEFVAQAPSGETVSQNNLATKVKFKRANGEEAFSLKPKENGLKVEGANGLEIARLTRDEQGKIKIKDPDDVTLGYVISEDKHLKIKNPEQTKELYILRQQADGDYKLYAKQYPLKETASDRQIYRIKRRNYGWEIETPQQESLYQVKNRDNKIVLRDQNEVSIISTKSDFSLLAVACFGLDVLTPGQQSALAYAIALRGENK